MKDSSTYNIRYVGFEGIAESGCRLNYAITAQGAPARSASIHIEQFRPRRCAAVKRP